MNISINTKVLARHNLSLGEFLIMLLGYFGIDYTDEYASLLNKDVISKNLFKEMGIVISDNTKKLITKILVESDDKLAKCGIDFPSLAVQLQLLYPEGNKPSTTYTWRGKTEDIILQLEILVSIYDFQFTEEEAIHAVQEYLASFDKLDKHTKLLKNFILKVDKDKGTVIDMESLFMTYIENFRDKASE